MLVEIKPCVFCGRGSHPIEVDEEAYNAWKAGVLIQNAFPNLSEDERELMITGTHSECWDEHVPK